MKVRDYFKPKPRTATDAIVKRLFEKRPQTKRTPIRRKPVFKRDLPV